MSRLLAGVRCDLEVQLRNGLYYAVGFVMAISAAVLTAIPHDGLARLLPAITLNNLAVTAFFFMAALTLLERDEYSRMARFVTPLREQEYLGAKLLSLLIPALAQHLVLGLVLVGPRPELGWLAMGVALATVIMVAAGLGLALRYRSINEMLLPAVPWIGLLLLPMLSDILGFEHWLLLLHPLQGPVLLMRAGVAPLPAPLISVAIATGAIWTGVALVLAVRALQRARLISNPE
jgi:fluoroquinolone transport system permease protein